MKRENKALERLKIIQWNVLDKTSHLSDEINLYRSLLAEYCRRLANFCIFNGNYPDSIFGGFSKTFFNDKILLSEASYSFIDGLRDYSISQCIYKQIICFNFLSWEAGKDQGLISEDFKNICEPLIVMFEKNGSFQFHKGYADFEDGTAMSLGIESGWKDYAREKPYCECND